MWSLVGVQMRLVGMLGRTRRAIISSRTHPTVRNRVLGWTNSIQALFSTWALLLLRYAHGFRVDIKIGKVHVHKAEAGLPSDAAGALHEHPAVVLLALREHQSTGGKRGFGRGWQLPLLAVAQPRPK
jgi:hypothetical protein